MHTPEWLAEQFEEHRAHLRAVGYRMLGSASEAEDAVQESWLRLDRTDVSAVENLRAWLTTVVARVCLDMYERGRRAGRIPWTCTCPIPSSLAPTGIRSPTPCSPTRSDSRSSWCWRPLSRRSGSHSCCTTCSA